jgi:hypothetical protein
MPVPALLRQPLKKVILLDFFDHFSRGFFKKPPLKMTKKIQEKSRFLVHADSTVTVCLSGGRSSFMRNDDWLFCDGSSSWYLLVLTIRQQIFTAAVFTIGLLQPFRQRAGIPEFCVIGGVIGVSLETSNRCIDEFLIFSMASEFVRSR